MASSADESGVKTRQKPGKAPRGRRPATGAVKRKSGAAAEAARDTTLSQKIRRALEEEIILGELRPTERIDETVVAQRFKASRTPVREALQGLASSGLVELRPRQGAVVAELTLAKLVEMFEAMAAYEGFCARLAARRIAPVELTQLRAAHDRCVRHAGDSDLMSFYDANNEFHEVIYRACRNTYFMEQTRLLRARLAPYRRYATFHPGRMAASLDEHATVIDAIAKGDQDRAENAMRTHLALLSEGFADLSAAMKSGERMQSSDRGS